MDFRIALPLLLFLAFSGSAQDSLPDTKQAVLVKRFDDILGARSRPVNSDSLVKLKSAIDTLMSSVLTMQESINALTIKNDRTLLIERYGAPGKWVAYDSKQKQFFGVNTFLVNLENKDKGSHIYFAYNETQTDFSAYHEQLLELSNKWKSNKNQHIHLDGYSDAFGKNKVNVVLSKERTLQVMRYLMSEFSIPESAFIIVYHGTKGDNRIKERDLDFLNRQVYVEVR